MAATTRCTTMACALGAVLAIVVTGAPAHADTRLDGPYAPSKVASYGGVTAWSRWFPQERVWRLVYDTNTSGRSQVVPVGGRSVPFDVDVGPGEDGGVVAVYSRCTTEPRFRASTRPLPAWATGRGCDLYRFDFRDAAETRIAGASTAANSEVLPTIWRGRLGFVRVYDGRPYVYVRAIGAQSPSRRQPGGGRGSTGLPGPMALDLVGDQLAFSWTYERSGGGVSEVRLDRVGEASHRKIVGNGWKRSLLRYVTPTLSEQYVSFGEQRMLAQDRGGTRSLGSWLWRYHVSTGALDRADAPAQLFAAVRDRRSDVAVLGTTGNGLDYHGCGSQGCLVYRVPFGDADVVRQTTKDASRCVASQLGARVRFGPGSGAAGHVEGDLRLTNASSTRCTLRGYPGVSFVGAGGRQVGVPAARSHTGKVRTVTLRPGQTSSARLQVTDVGVYGRAQCDPVVARGYRVYPPDGRSALFVPRPTRTCRSDVRVATIGPMRPPGSS